MESPIERPEEEDELGEGERVQGREAVREAAKGRGFDHEEVQIEETHFVGETGLKRALLRGCFSSSS